jgi:hypothetical protein
MSGRELANASPDDAKLGRVILLRWLLSRFLIVLNPNRKPVEPLHKTSGW